MLATVTATATRDDVYQNYPSTAPTRYETLSAAQSLASLERTLHTLLSPFDYPTAGEWLDDVQLSFELPGPVR